MERNQTKNSKTKFELMLVSFHHTYMIRQHPKFSLTSPSALSPPSLHPKDHPSPHSPPHFIILFMPIYSSNTCPSSLVQRRDYRDCVDFRDCRDCRDCREAGEVGLWMTSYNWGLGIRDQGRQGCGSAVSGIAESRILDGV